MSRNLINKVNKISREYLGYPFTSREKLILSFARMLVEISLKLDKARLNFIVNNWLLYRNHENSLGRICGLLYLVSRSLDNTSRKLRKPFVNTGLFETTEWQKQYFARFSSSKGLFG